MRRLRHRRHSHARSRYRRLGPRLGAVARQQGDGISGVGEALRERLAIARTGARNHGHGSIVRVTMSWSASSIELARFRRLFLHVQENTALPVPCVEEYLRHSLRRSFWLRRQRAHHHLNQLSAFRCGQLAVNEPPGDRSPGVFWHFARLEALQSRPDRRRARSMTSLGEGGCDLLGHALAGLWAGPVEALRQADGLGAPSPQAASALHTCPSLGGCARGRFSASRPAGPSRTRRTRRRSGASSSGLGHRWPSGHRRRPSAAAPLG